MKIALYSRLARTEISFLPKLIREIQNFGFDLLLHHSIVERLNDEGISAIKSFDENSILKDVDYLFSIGGDGTLLDAIAYVRNFGIPVLGINTGRLGFLSSAQSDGIQDVLNAIKKKSYTLDQRTLLNLDIPNNPFGDLNFALNDFVVYKQDPVSMVTIHAYLNGKHFNSYWGNGLIIATPTGSTAYSLSCGGPILMPDAESFIINPIAPHNLNVRPIVIKDSQEITLKLEGRTQHFLISLDSRSQKITPSTEIKITKSRFKINLIRFDNQDFFATLKSKMMWGTDKRN